MKNKFEIHEKDKNGYIIIYRTDDKDLIDIFIEKIVKSETRDELKKFYLKSHLFEPAMLNLEYFK